MDSNDVEQLTALLQAHTIALCALLATHPAPQRLRPTFELFAGEALNPHPTYAQTLSTLRKAIPDR